MSDWRPIETAPRDGSLVLLFSPIQPRTIAIGWWHSSNVTVAATGGWWGAHGVGAYRGPTHWMPLPDPPKAPTP